MNGVQLLWGIVVIVGFLITGAFMKGIIDPLGDMSLERMMYRANHIYLLMSGLVVVVWAQRRSYDLSGVLKWAEGVATGLILLAPIMFVAAFALEAGVEDSLRLWTFWAVIVQFSGVVLSALLTVFIHRYSDR